MTQPHSLPTSRYRCDCGRSYPSHYMLPIHCPCGGKIGTNEPESQPAKLISRKPKKRIRVQQLCCPVNPNANICRLCPSGRYDRERDACIEVIEIGLAKNQRRAGKINWLHSHAAAKCPLGHF